MTKLTRLERIGECIYLGMYTRHGIDPHTAPPIDRRAARWLALLVICFYIGAIVLLLGYC